MNQFFSKYFLYLPSTILKGENVLGRLRAARQFQYLTRGEVEQYQLQKLQKMVSIAFEGSPFYRRMYTAAGVGPDMLKTLDDLKRLPEITKKDLVDHMESMLTTRHPFWASRKTTGGSTGQAVTLLKNPSALAMERAVTARSYEWAGVRIGDPQARFWGVPLHQVNRAKYRVVDFIANRKRFSAFAVDDENREVYFKKIANFKPAYIYGYASAVLDFANFVKKREYALPASVVSVITTSEVLTSSIRKTLEDVFKVPVFNEYGCGEVGSIAHECEVGGMHLMEDNLIVECDPQQTGGAGELVVTDLFNYLTPLIRYRIGDYATFSSNSCKCGRSLRTIVNVHGRAYDKIITPDGKEHHPEMVMYIFEDIKDRHGCIDQFQFIQTSPDSAMIRIVKGRGYSPKIEEIVVGELRRRLHPKLQVVFEYVGKIDREQSGKLRLIKSEINKGVF